MSYEEIWKDIEGYEGIYQVSNKGNVKSLSRNVLRNNGKMQFINEKILKPQDSGHGYNRVNLYKNKKPRLITVHSLVLETFTNKREKDMVINHIDGDKKNNTLKKLRMVYFQRKHYAWVRNWVNEKRRKTLASQVERCSNFRYKTYLF